MGEAKRRGSYAQRVQEGIEKEVARVKKLEDDRRQYLKDLTSEQREKREKAMKFLAVAQVVGAVR